MQSIVSIENVSKTYASGHRALDSVSLEIREGEILALLGPNGAGKTTLISIVCGLVNPTSGQVAVGGHDNVEQFRQARELIGLVPQELTLGAFDTVWNTISFSRGLFGKRQDPEFLEQLLRDLTLLDKRNSELRELSGGMKRRVLIAKALSHQPRILFLDEPTAGVDVELRKDMWAMVETLRASGVTIILTTHYIEEAEAIADRVGVINRGKLLLVEDKNTLMKTLGRKRLIIELREPIGSVPDALAPYALELLDDCQRLAYTYDSAARHTGITALIGDLNAAGLGLCDLNTEQTSLEEIFVTLVEQKT